MGAAAEQRNERRIVAQGRARDAEQRGREIQENAARGVYDQAQGTPAFRAALGQAAAQWAAPRPQTHDYATRAQAAQAARAAGKDAFPLRCFTAFESFWTVAEFSAAGAGRGEPLRVEGRTYACRRLEADEVQAMPFRSPPRKPVYRVTAGA